MKTLLFLTLLLSFLTLHSQNTRFGTYNEQRKSLFEALPDTKREIIFLGNSITDGGEWTELFNNKHVKNRGISGDITEGVLNRLPEITSAKPAKVFLLIGINDLARNISTDSVYNNICLIAGTVHKQSPKTKVYVQSILPVNDSFGTFKGHTGKTAQIIEINALLSEWCPKNGCIFIDLFSRFKNPDNNRLNPQYTNDGLHLMGEGYILWAEIIRTYMK